MAILLTRENHLSSDKFRMVIHLFCEEKHDYQVIIKLHGDLNEAS